MPRLRDFPLKIWIRVRLLLSEPKGQTMTEYAMLIGFLAVALILAIIFLRDRIGDLFRHTGSSIEQAPSTTTGPVQP